MRHRKKVSFPRATHKSTWLDRLGKEKKHINKQLFFVDGIGEYLFLFTIESSTDFNENADTTDERQYSQYQYFNMVQLSIILRYLFAGRQRTN